MSVMTWHLRFLNLADHLSSWSKDPSTKVGSVIVKDRKVLGIGYNGFPCRVHDTPERLTDRPTKYALTIHAEANAILNTQGRMDGSTIYVSPLSPCSECAKLIINAGISHVVSRQQEANDRWTESQAYSDIMFREAGIEHIKVPKL